jgi:hypothetical protein
VVTTAESEAKPTLRNHWCVGRDSNALGHCVPTRRSLIARDFPSGSKSVRNARNDAYLHLVACHQRTRGDWERPEDASASLFVSKLKREDGALECARSVVAPARLWSAKTKDFRAIMTARECPPPPLRRCPALRSPFAVPWAKRESPRSVRRRFDPAPQREGCEMPRGEHPTLELSILPTEHFAAYRAVLRIFLDNPNRRGAGVPRLIGTSLYAPVGPWPAASGSRMTRCPSCWIPCWSRLVY